MLVHNHCIVFARHPRGMPANEEFRFEEVDLPEASDGEVVIRAPWLSIDPYVPARRGRGRGRTSSVRPRTVTAERWYRRS
jgi:NADPH:quinone reductase